MRKAFIYQSALRNALVAVVENKIVGFCDFGPIRSDKESSLGEIYAIYVLKKYQNHGIGSTLFNQAMRSLEELGYQKFIIWALELNTPATDFYKKNKGIKCNAKIRLFDNIPYNELQFTFTL